MRLARVIAYLICLHEMLFAVCVYYLEVSCESVNRVYTRVSSFLSGKQCGAQIAVIGASIGLPFGAIDVC